MDGENINKTINTLRFNKLLEFRKERKYTGMLYDIFSTGLILLLWYGFDNYTFSIIYLMTYILSIIGYSREINYIDDEIKYELNKMKAHDLQLDN